MFYNLGKLGYSGLSWLNFELVPIFMVAGLKIGYVAVKSIIITC